MIPRREPRAVILAHKLDPERREVYVEGRSDKLFLLWIAGDDLHKDALIREISAIEFSDNIAGGEKGRLLHFAELVKETGLSIRFFSDADYDRLLDRITALPSNVTLTDGRDIEAYFLREDCFEKIVNLAIRTDRFSGQDLLNQIIHICKELAVLRIYSELNELALPFRRTSLRRHLEIAGFHQLHINLESYLGVLLQKANMSLELRGNILESLAGIQEEYQAADDTELVHGKDLIEVLGEVFLANNQSRESAEPVLRTSFDRSLVNEYPSLANINAFITS